MNKVIFVLLITCLLAAGCEDNTTTSSQLTIPIPPAKVESQSPPGQVESSQTPAIPPAAEPATKPTIIPLKIDPPKPVTQSSCDPNYSGCVPIASDVDCAGGSGNGPAYARGPVTVTGSDIYELDRDGDGVGCE